MLGLPVLGPLVAPMLAEGLVTRLPLAGGTGVGADVMHASGGGTWVTGPLAAGPRAFKPTRANVADLGFLRR